MKSDVSQKASQIVSALQRLKDKDDRKALADLRGGLSEAKEYKTWPYIMEWCDLNNARMKTIVTTFAAIFAVHQNHVEGYGSFGKSIRTMALLKNKNSGIPEALECYLRHINKIMACDSSLDLCTRLPFYARMLKNEGVPIDYVALYEDIIYWGGTQHISKIKWMTDYKKGGSNVPDKNIDK